MSRNRRRNENPIELASVVKWTLLAAILGGFGLCYVYLKNQMHAYGHEKRRLERDLEALVVQNSAVRAQIAQLTSRTALQRRVDEGFVKLVVIPDTQLVRLNPGRSAPGPRLLGGDSEILPVSNEIIGPQ